MSLFRRSTLPLLFSAKTWVLIISDICSICVAFFFAYAMRIFFSGYLSFSTYFFLLPLITIFPLFFALLRLYPAEFMYPAEELKRLFLAISSVFLLFAATFFMTKSADTFSRAFFLVFWLSAVCIIPFARFLVRQHFSHAGWWKTTYIVAGDKKVLFQYLASSVEKVNANLLPVALVCVGKTDEELVVLAQEQGLEIHCTEKPWNFLFSSLAASFPDAIFMAHLSENNTQCQEQLLDAAGEFFKQVVLLPDAVWSYCLPSQIVYLGETYGLAVKRNLADKNRLYCKRVIDLFAACCMGILAIPLIGILAFLIKRDSEGPVFFRQKRIGQGGKDIYVFKFRTMVVNAEEVLNACLQKSPELQTQWDENQKLRGDPRITKIGDFLRRTSLDELPQLLNVFIGDMSLVGPRPIVRNEVGKYGDVFRLYCLVPPGITGLWQVSGRSNTSYKQRVWLDRYYIANWSVWLDIYILIKTIPVVFAKKGAY